MSDYISREVILENVLNQMAKSASTLAMSERIKNLQEADVVERKHGKWKRKWDHRNGFDYAYEECSECGAPVDVCGYDYCPNCGADMRGDDDV